MCRPENTLITGRYRKAKRVGEKKNNHIMKKNLLLIAIAGLTMLTAESFAQSKKCATMEILNKRVLEDPSILDRREIAEAETQKWITENRSQGRNESKGTAALFTIPVVVHVIWNTEVQNVSDSQIASQMTVLNQDFSNSNPNAIQEGQPFFEIADNADYEFCMATVDPSGNATTGITRTQTAITEWTDNLTDDLFSTSAGGFSNWDPTKYLNIYVCVLNDNNLGFASFPDELAGAPEKDAVVIDFRCFGITGTAGTDGFDAQNGGRTATHEVGHWLNLRHIWGDDPCGNDMVDDTPPQQTSNSGCPTYPHNAGTTCTPDAEGEMFMNYMDYVDDNCMSAFSLEQLFRMDAALSGTRSGISTSNGCDAVSSTADQIDEKSIELYPNPNDGNFTLNFKNATFTNTTVSIFNVLGERVKAINLTNINSTQIDLSEFGFGSYFVQISSDQGTLTKKVIVTK